MKALKYRAGAALSAVALVAGFAAPVAAAPGSYSIPSHHVASTTTNTNSNNTTTTTNTRTDTDITTTTTTNTFTNSGIYQSQGSSYPGMPSSFSEYGGGGGSQTAVQGDKSGVYKVNIDQHQTTTQSNETGNMAFGQWNETTQDNSANHSEDQSSTQTNSNTQTLNQSNTTTQSQSVSQSAQGVTVN